MQAERIAAAYAFYATPGAENWYERCGQDSGSNFKITPGMSWNS
jgi:hypothetical protein